MSYSPHQLAYFAHQLTRRAASNSMDRMAGALLDAQVDLNPHQIDAALFATSNPLSKGAILADEVGLGKTIEAGLLIAQKWAERKRRILVITPANLRKQWHQELADKFGIAAGLLEAKSYRQAIKDGATNPFDLAGNGATVLICSYQFAAGKAKDVQSVPWDLVVIDEAHRLRNVYKPENKTARILRDALTLPHKVLLTATPLQNSLLELFGLVSFIDEKVFGDLDSFRSQFGQLKDAASFDTLKNRIAPICKRTLRRQVEAYVKYTRRIPMLQEFVPGADETKLYNYVSEFLQRPSLYALPNSQRQLITLGGIEVNIFNISKINSEVRGGKSPKIKRLSEYLGQSYFEYLAGLDDLVLIMDESHRYRASAGIRSLNELRPLLGLELTATPFVEGTGGKTTPFKNVVMDYPLARAIEDGFVKEPAVVTQQNFDPSAHSAGALETIKLQDGVRVHEETKVHLLNYYQNSAQQTGDKLVKPFILVIARDTTHAAQLMATIESDDFFAGRYKGKVIQVDSSRSGAEEEEMIRRLLAVESYDEPTEIVIHVNMLKEGWDVTNLYTIVPLRAANARTLIEQSIGRGLRLPYGRKTGVDVVDRLNIIAHDKFQEVIDEAGRGDSPIRMQALVLTPLNGNGGTGSSLKSISVQPTANAMLGTVTAGTPQVPGANLGNAAGGTQYGTSAPTTVFKTDEQRQIAQVAMDVIAEISREREPGPNGQPLVASTQALTQASIQQQITQRVQERMLSKQGDLLATGPSPVSDIVQQTVAVLVEHTIDIPRISVVPKGPVKSGYKLFKLDLSKMNFQPQDMALVGQGLKTGKQVLYGQSSRVLESQLENYIVRELINYDDVSYDEHAELIYELSGQAVAHFKTYLQTDDELHNILGNYGKTIAENIHLQMALHYYEDISESEVVISQGFTPLKHCAFTAEGDILPLHQAPAEKGKIAQYVYGGFGKCAYPVQKFHSDTERVLACVLERDALRWFRPVAGQFNIYYRSGANQPEYVPDFVAATADHNLIIETKAAKDMEAGDVKAKADAAATWCKNASAYSQARGGKPWKYLLVPHDAVAHNATVSALAGRYLVAAA